MSQGVDITKSLPLAWSSYIAGQPVKSDDMLEVRYPWDGSLTGTLSKINSEQLEQAIQAALDNKEMPTKNERYEILMRARDLLAMHADEFANLIRLEAGLCMRETRYEVGRAQEVFKFAAAEALRDDESIFSCDAAKNGPARKIFTLREPLSLVVAITPFNHPLNQVAHKLAPAIAAGVPVLLKPSSKTPLTAIRLTELLYEAGLPKPMLSTFVGDRKTITEALVKDSRVDLVTFTGGTEPGKYLTNIAGYKKLCLELGGNAPLIILRDADLDLAAILATEGSFRNSGQRCTAVKRILVEQEVLEQFTTKFLNKASEFKVGDPSDEGTLMGTVIDESAAIELEQRVIKAVDSGAKVLLGGNRKGAQLEPTIIANVPRDAEMVCEESFGPLAPIMSVRDIDDAIALANSSAFGLSSGVVTNDMAAAIKVVKELKTGAVNVNQVPGFRMECSPFGGVKDSGLGIKEGVIEAMKFMTTTKTFSLPW